jgi:phospholipid/cholesterol/gamma-HCH transport system permease protein
VKTPSLADWPASDLLHVEFDGDTATFLMPERLCAATLGELWHPYFSTLRQYQPKNLIVDASAVQYCDGAGVQLLIELENFQTRHNAKYVLRNLLPEGTALLSLVQKLPTAKQQSLPADDPWLVHLGKLAEARLHGMYFALGFFGQVLVEIGRCLLKPNRMPARDTFRIIEAVGPESWPIVSLMGVILGLILGFEGAIALKQFGAQVFVANLVGISLARELAPLMAAILLIGRSGSAFAAEIGSMTVNQEVDALRTMAIDPVRYLVMPRVLAAFLMMPFMTILLLFFGFVGCAVVMQSLNFSMLLYINQLSTAVSLGDLFSGLFKTFFFGILVAIIGCYRGLSTQQGASAVGVSATQSVVQGIIGVIVLDGLFGVIYYNLGI